MAKLDVYKIGSPSENEVTLSDNRARSGKAFYFEYEQVVPTSITISSNVSWCRATYGITSGAGTSSGRGEISIEVDENATDAVRVATITMSANVATYGTPTITGIGKVNQPNAEGQTDYDAEFVITDTSKKINYLSQNGYIDYTGKNVGKIDVYSDSDWCTVYVTNDKKITWMVTSNNDIPLQTDGEQEMEVMPLSDDDSEVASKASIIGGSGTIGGGATTVNSQERSATISIYAYDSIRGKLISSYNYTLVQESNKAGIIVIQPSSLDIDYTTWSGSVDVVWNNVKSFDAVTFVPNLGTTWQVNGYTTISGESGRKTLTVNVSENRETAHGGQHISRQLIAQINYTDKENNAKIAGFAINQGPSPEIIEFPIWRDCDIDINCDKYVDYKIVYNNNMIYSGRAYGMDGKATVRVNDILKNYCIPSINFNLEGIQNNNSYIEATLYISYDEWATEGQTYAKLRTYNDWSYGDHSKYLSDLIRNEIDSRQYLLLSAFNSKSSLSPTTIEVSTSNSTYSIKGETDTLLLPMNGYMGNVTITTSEGENTIPVVCSKKGYCLYYLNRNGGYDWLLLNGKVQRLFTISTSSYKRKINNYINPYDRQTVQYQKNITQKWTLNTGILNDTQSKKFVQNVIPSTQVWLHDLNEDKIYPVNVTDTSATEQMKRYTNKPITYSFTAELAQDRYMR